MAKDVLLEIGTEEIPSSYIEPAIRQMAQMAEQLLKLNILNYESIKTFATPRRLVLYIEKLAEKSEDRVEEITGPSAKMLHDNQGDFTPAAKGFAAKHNIAPEKLTVKKTEKGEYLCVVKKIHGEKAEKILSQILPEIIKKIYFPKTMIWEKSGFRFARPIRTITALYHDKVIKFSIAGIKTGNFTIGLHTLSYKKLKIRVPEFYIDFLRNNCVIINQEERKNIVHKVLESAAGRVKGTIIKDDSLVDEVNYLIEHPVAILGRFDEKYLKLPSEVLITCMRKKQKCFAINDESGKLTNYFIGIRNGISEHQDIVKEGYERVLVARLADAEFFFNKDVSSRLETKAEKLKGVMFQQKLGTVSDKMTRVELSALYINEKMGNAADNEKLKKACMLAKADLVTDLVYEYPELQGVVGRIYALHDGESSDTAMAVEEHYWPLTADGKLPSANISVILSIADKIDTITGNFAAGLIPTGSADPYGLRRMAIGVLRIILERKLSISLKPLIEKSFSLLPEKLKENKAVVDQVMDFFQQRLENIWESEGYKFDEIRSIIAIGFSDLIDAGNRIVALKNIRSQKDFEPLAAAFKRASNILKQAEKNKVVPSSVISEDLFVEEAEKNLFISVRTMEQDIKTLFEKKNYYDALQKMVALKPVVDDFFEKVMVMAEDEKVRANRLAILNYTISLFFTVLDFSLLQG